MARRPTEQTPLLDKPHNIVDVDADVEPGALPTCKTAAPGGPTQMGAPAGDCGDCGGSGGSGTGSGNGKKTKMTPIPWRQLLTLCLVRLVDPICFSQVFPYINDMLLGMGVVGPNEPERVGFYSGLIESTFSVAVALAIYPWARLSDQVGRKPVLLYGIIGVTAAMVSFGMGNKYWMLIVARVLGGLASGNSAAVHSLVGEMTDDTNAPQVFPIYGLCHPIGTMIGPLIGGVFADAPQKWPSVFPGSFWKSHPYAVPSFICAALTLLSLAFGLFFLEETHPDIKLMPRQATAVRRSSFTDQPRHTAKDLLQIPVIRALFFSGFFLCYISTAYDILLVLFAFTPVSLGGLGFGPERIGYVLAAAGIGGTFVSIIALPWLLKRWSPGRVYAVAMALWPFAFMILPMTNWAARLSSVIQGQANERSEAMIWVGIVLSLVMSKAACAAFGCNMLLVRQSAPSPNSLGATNGIVHLSINVARGISPWLTSAIFAVTIEHHLLDGTLWVWIMVALSIAGQRFAARVPALEKPFTRVL